MSFMTLGLIGVLWVLYDYSLSSGKDMGGVIGGLNFLGLNNVGQEPSTVYATTVPHLTFIHIYFFRSDLLQNFAFL